MATQQNELSKYNHVTLTGGPVTIWYGETKADGTADVKAIQLFSKKFTLYPSAGSVVIGPDTVGTDAIIDGSVQKQDLADEVKDGLVGQYDEQDEQLNIG